MRDRMKDRFASLTLSTLTKWTRTHEKIDRSLSVSLSRSYALFNSHFLFSFYFLRCCCCCCLSIGCGHFNFSFGFIWNHYFMTFFTFISRNQELTGTRKKIERNEFPEYIHFEAASIVQTKAHKPYFFLNLNSSHKWIAIRKWPSSCNYQSKYKSKPLEKCSNYTQRHRNRILTQFICRFDWNSLSFSQWRRQRAVHCIETTVKIKLNVNDVSISYIL